MQKIPKTASFLVVLAIFLTLALGSWLIWSRTNDAGGSKPQTTAFFTTDDGATWFVDDISRLTPFDHGGKSAVRAYMFSCGGGSPQVGYLERYTEEGKALNEKLRADAKASPDVMPKSLQEVAQLGIRGMEVKKPGDKEWVNMTDPAAVQIMHVPCPGGAIRTPVNP